MISSGVTGEGAGLGLFAPGMGDEETMTSGGTRGLGLLAPKFRFDFETVFEGAGGGARLADEAWERKSLGGCVVSCWAHERSETVMNYTNFLTFILLLFGGYVPCLQTGHHRLKQ